MSSAPRPEMVEEALRDIAPFDSGGQMAEAIKQVGKLASAAGYSEGTVNREHLTLVITGDERACETLAKAYTKALYGYGLIEGIAGNAHSNSIDWTSQICDMGASRSMIEHSWASRRMTEAGKDARSGTLVIRNIHEKPYEGCVDEAESSAPALKGGLEAVTEFVIKGTWGPRTPVVIMTGPEAETRAFMTEAQKLTSLFNCKSVNADAPPPSPEVYPTELESTITARRPLAFKARPA